MVPAKGQILLLLHSQEKGKPQSVMLNVFICSEQL